MKYYHNPKCSKSRLGKAALEEKGIEFSTKEYLKEGLTVEEIKQIKDHLGIPVTQFVRKKEAKDLGIDLKTVVEQDLIEKMAQNPILLERPILDNGKIARIGRPTEDLFEVL